MSIFPLVNRLGIYWEYQQHGLLEEFKEALMAIQIGAPPDMFVDV
jgi:hypothetical protein